MSARSHYWAVRPKAHPELARIEYADTAMQAYELAFGRGNPMGAWEAKDLGSRVSVVRSDRQRIAALNASEGWLTLGRPFSRRVA